MTRRVHERELRAAILDQWRFIEAQGGTLAGYERTYGDYGDGFEAIYRADVAHLESLQAEYAMLDGARAGKQSVTARRFGVDSLGCRDYR